MVAPANDNWANALTVTLDANGQYVSATIDATGATEETGQPVPFAGATHSVWWKYTPAANGAITLDTELGGTAGTDDTILAVYTGAAVDALTLVASNDDSVPGTEYRSRISSLPVTGGTTYSILVASFGQSYQYVLRVVDAAAVPAPTPVDTATPYANDGYNYGGGVSEVDFDPPIAVSPARIRPPMIRRVHQSIPAPTLVDGRPV